jgi:hypothetical protein
MNRFEAQVMQAISKKNLLSARAESVLKRSRYHSLHLNFSLLLHEML